MIAASCEARRAWCKKARQKARTGLNTIFTIVGELVIHVALYNSLQAKGCVWKESFNLRLISMIF